MMRPMTPDMISENARAFKRRGFAEPDAMRQALSPSTPSMVGAQPVAQMGPPPPPGGPMMRPQPVPGTATGEVLPPGPPPPPQTGVAGGLPPSPMAGAPSQPPSPMAQLMLQRQMRGPSRM